MPEHVGLQGNLDPAIVAAGWGPTEPAVLDVLRRGGGNPGGRGGHVFNLGHGVLPETDPETLERVVALVARLRPTARTRPDDRSAWW